MTSVHTLRGGCHCGRNLYIVQLPQNSTEHARLLFDPTPLHRTALASPLPAYLRVPLTWYHSTTNAFFPSETPATIRRAYDHQPLNSDTEADADADAELPVRRRHFCGFCGTPLTYWSDSPRPEADYIRLALGSLNADDLDQLEDWVGSSDDDGADVSEGDGDGDGDGEGEGAQEEDPSQPRETDIVSSTGLPWLDRFVEGSRLERRLLNEQRRQRKAQQQFQDQPGVQIQRHEHQAATSADGTVRVEWEVVEWTEADEDAATAAAQADAGSRPARTSSRGLPSSGSSKPSAKRARVASDDEEGMDVET